MALPGARAPHRTALAVPVARAPEAGAKQAHWAKRAKAELGAKRAHWAKREPEVKQAHWAKRAKGELGAKRAHRVGNKVVVQIQIVVDPS